ncbi:MAG: hypothetical protein GXP38_10740 [Chloroflexi bacterium]|nr:hypothetical protein [Chloroflexota bacterium]
MHKPYHFFWLLLLAILLVPAPTIAQGPPISYPPETELVRGVVDIRGTATHPDFWKYELAAAPYGTQNWFNITVSEIPVQDGVLGSWNTQTVPDGTYTLRLRVVHRDGNYDEFKVQRILVANSLPTETPTPEISPTPTVTPTPIPPTATPVFITPEIPTPTPAATPTPTSLAAADNGNSGSGGENSPLQLAQQAVRGFLRGASIVLAIFLAVGFFFGVKNLLTWLYYRFLV